MAAKPVTAAKVIQKTARKKRKQTKSDSQALPVVEQKSSLENNMAELKKSKKQTEKKAPFSEQRQDSITANTAVDLNIAPYRERPGEDYMSSNQQAHFRRLLLERKRMLLEDMGRTMHHGIVNINSLKKLKVLYSNWMKDTMVFVIRVAWRLVFADSRHGRQQYFA